MRSRSAPLAPGLTGLLSAHPLAALRRDENLGDPQPHPAFCLTTVGFWKEIEGDWSAGPMWENDVGTMTDVGGELLVTLREQDLPWRPILRTNTDNIHPVWFGVYEHRIYHHGAGFRPRVSRLDILRAPDVYGTVNPTGPAIDPAPKRRDRARPRLAKRRGTASGQIRGAPAALRHWMRQRTEARDQRRRDRRLHRDERQAERVFSWIVEDDDFYLRLDRAAADD